jgi:Carboxypeptidase regulatory-like domain
MVPLHSTGIYRLVYALGLLLISVSPTSVLHAQEIRGNVIDEKKEPVINAAVQVFRDGRIEGCNITDYDGNYFIKPLEPAHYDVLVTFLGYDSMIVKDVLVVPGQATTLNFQIAPRKGLDYHLINRGGYRSRPPINNDKHNILTREEISGLANEQPTRLLTPTQADPLHQILAADINKLLLYAINKNTENYLNKYTVTGLTYTRQELDQMPH